MHLLAAIQSYTVRRAFRTTVALRPWVAARPAGALSFLRKPSCRRASPWRAWSRYVPSSWPRCAFQSACLPLRSCGLMTCAPKHQMIACRRRGRCRRTTSHRSAFVPMTFATRFRHEHCRSSFRRRRPCSRSPRHVVRSRCQACRSFGTNQRCDRLFAFACLYMTTCLHVAWNAPDVMRLTIIVIRSKRHAVQPV